jgi:hypothetical protein
MMYSVTVLFDASRSVSVEADSPEEAEEKAHNQVGSASLCHQCSDEIDIGDATGALVYKDDGAGDQVLDTQWSSQRIASLEAEVAALKADRDRLDYLAEISCGSIRLYSNIRAETFFAWGTGLRHANMRDAIDAMKGGAA